MIVIVENGERLVNIKGLYQLVDSKQNENGVALCNTETFFLKTEDDEVMIVHNEKIKAMDIRQNDEFKIVHSFNQVFNGDR